MRSVVAVHPQFDGVWPYAAGKFAERLAHDGDVTFLRVASDTAAPLHTLVEQFLPRSKA